MKLTKRQQQLKEIGETLTDTQKQMIRLVRNYPGTLNGVHANTMGWKGENSFNLQFGNMCKDQFAKELGETPPPTQAHVEHEDWNDAANGNPFFSGLLVNAIRPPYGQKGLAWALAPDAAIAFEDL